MKDEITVQEFVISDVLWELMEPLLPVRRKPVHPFCRYGTCHPRSEIPAGFALAACICRSKAVRQRTPRNAAETVSLRHRQQFALDAAIQQVVRRLIAAEAVQAPFLALP
jgi:hypothetical protein